METKIDENGLSILQNELRLMLREYIDFCNNKSLSYFLYFGSLLGAVRHKGIIPWDDDIDIVMPRPDYELFLGMVDNHRFRTFIGDNYTLDHFTVYAPNCRLLSKKVYIRKDKTAHDVEKKKERWLPASISIFPVDGLPDNPLVRKSILARTKLNYLLLRISRSVNSTDALANRSAIEKIGIRINNITHLGQMFSIRNAADRYNRLLSRHDFSEGEFCFVAWFADNIRPVNYSKPFLSSIESEFDDLIVRIPRDYDILLKELYGDYMELPPEDKRYNRHCTEVKIIGNKDL